MKNWTISRSTERPDEIDTSSSKTTVYIRRNIREIEVDSGMDDGQKVKMYEYEEKKMTKEEFMTYIDILENKNDISDTQSAVLDMDSESDRRMSEIENCIMELDQMVNG